MDNLKIKVDAELIAIERSCINCATSHLTEIKPAVSDTVWTNIKGIVFKDNVCKKCGCNTFNVDCEVELVASELTL